MYVCQLSVLQLLIWPVIGIFIHFKWRLPEAICCLQTCNVDVVLLVMYCMYIPAFTVTSANKSQLCVYSCYLLISCLRLFVFVYKAKFAKLRPLPCGRPSGRRVLTSLFSLSVAGIDTDQLGGNDEPTMEGGVGRDGARLGWIDACCHSRLVCESWPRDPTAVKWRSRSPHSVH